jgi:hypothetical protein
VSAAIATFQLRNADDPLRVLLKDRNSVFKRWVERCKKCIACQGTYFEKIPSPHLHKVPTRSNKVSPGTWQTALVN